MTCLIDTANAPIFGIDILGKVTEWNAKASSCSATARMKLWVRVWCSGSSQEDYKASVDVALASALMGRKTEWPRRQLRQMR